MIYRFLLFPKVACLISSILFCFFFSGFSQSELLDIHIQDERVVIKAEEVELKKILQAISLETGMQFSFFASETSEVISCKIDEPSIASSLSSLLKNWNYSLVFGKNVEGSMIPESLWLVGKVSDNPHFTTLQTSAETVGNPDDHVKHLQKNVFADLFKDELIRAKQMKAKKLEHSSGQVDETSPYLLPGQSGIQITALDLDSAFSKIGLHTGDIVYDVNGMPINSVKDFINAMKAPEGQSIVRIERYKDAKTIDPIYIEIH